MRFIIMMASFLLALTIGITHQVNAQAAWSPQPWLEDLAQMHDAFKTKYANLEWLETEREVDLDALVARVETRLRTATSDAEAKAIFDRMIARMGDGHVSLSWPSQPSQNGGAGDLAPAPPNICADLGFDSGKSAAGLGTRIGNYRAVGDDAVFPAGIVHVGRHRVGVIRIGIFEPQGSPGICQSALQALRIPADSPCDDPCRDRVLTWSYNDFTTKFEAQLRALKAAGATSLLVDIANNGGGSEWAEAAARSVSHRTLTSAAMGHMRGPHWSRQWGDLAQVLRQAAGAATAADQRRLGAWASAAEDMQRAANDPCVTAGTCPRIGRLGFATGLVGSARPGEFAGKPWADRVFSIAQFPYHDGVWSGPLMVLVDSQSWSAAEQFAAVLQDNRAAIIIGERTGGAGCGRTYGGTPTLLKNSGAMLEVPDCVRFRADGSNEVSGVIPDILVGMRGGDAPAFKARLITAALPQAVALAERQRRSGR